MADIDVGRGKAGEPPLNPSILGVGKPKPLGRITPTLQRKLPEEQKTMAQVKELHQLNFVRSVGKDVLKDDFSVSNLLPCVSYSASGAAEPRYNAYQW